MISTDNLEMLKELIKEVLEKMTFTEFTLGVREESGTDGDGGDLILNIETKESDLLIGQQGGNLRALQHILRAMARRKTSEKLRFSIDINDYRKSKIGSLESLAQAMARQAADEKRSIVLRPMSAYERRIIHLTLSESDQVKTESIGEGEDRKVVIKPVGSIEDQNKL